VADGARAKERLGFEALHSSRDALMAYLRYRHPESEPQTMEAQP
jgi:hypothetical protein